VPQARQQHPHVRAACSLAALATLSAIAAPACSSDNQGASASTLTTHVTTSVDQSTTTSELSTTTSTTASPSSTTSTPGSSDVDHQEIVDRYVGYWQARFDANSGTPNPDYPALAEYATGSQLDAVIAETRANLDAGVAFQARENSVASQKVTVVSVEGGEAVVQECVVDDGLLVRRATGEILNDDISTHNVRGRLLRVEGKWRVAGTTLVQRWEGVAGCALAS
jgi:hypothetical protein